ncbi:hypothetical protein B0I35DRAFT_439540 [Stachybotrys elegans]|uniref:Clr5 domain-containing protein n=1 Tax=Stachybotrys elegans TaxID=80388 RepID=A0A8K0SI19_9HYPO|nr:hypothetical protein B0I35DRAFT_439540 [Stachybotrys elegans]
MRSSMEQLWQDLRPQSGKEKFQHIRHKERWEHLKPVIVQLYTREHSDSGRKTGTVPQIVDFMKVHYGFHATPNEYRNHFRQWNVAKRLVRDEKEDVASALGRRKRPGTSTSLVQVQHGDQTQSFSPRKLARYITGKMNHRLPEPMMPGLLSSWTLPYAAFVSTIRQDPNEHSPFGPLGTTPSYLNIRSPEATSPSGGANAPSPNMDLVYQYARQQHTNLFLQGRTTDLLVSLGSEQRRVLIDYFHDFYLHGLHLARGWGREPSNTVRVPMQFPTQHSTQPPRMWSSSRFLSSSPSPSPGSRSATNLPSPPTELCQWSIHLGEESFAPVNNVSHPSQPAATSEPPSSFTHMLHQTLASGDFTDTPCSDLPISSDCMLESIQNDKRLLGLDAWKLAIIAGNSDLIYDLSDKRKCPPGLPDIYPFHLAAAFINGGHGCCGMFGELFHCLPEDFIFRNNIDKDGHTILDALMLSVLRSHTRIHPADVSHAFRSTNRFPGEEQDICGRWNPEHPQVRELFKNGFARVPSSWKHCFCHTAVQAICHAIIHIYAPSSRPDVNTRSGLFIRRCTECGLELKLRPLHTVVVVAFYLAQHGMPGETLFGALAVLATLISLGADVSLEVDISVVEILQNEASGVCSHKPLCPLKLMEAVPDHVREAWTEDCQTGWGCIYQLFVHRKRDIYIYKKWKMMPSLDSYCALLAPECSEDCPKGNHFGDENERHERYQRYEKYEMHDCCHGYIHERLKLPHTDPTFGRLWASIQTEWLTYRRITSEDGWISDRFGMKELLEWLEGSSIDWQNEFYQSNMMKRHSPCGWFEDADDWLLPTAVDVSDGYFMNMDIWDRSSFLPAGKLGKLYGAFLFKRFNMNFLSAEFLDQEHFQRQGLDILF